MTDEPNAIDCGYYIDEEAAVVYADITSGSDLSALTNSALAERLNVPKGQVRVSVSGPCGDE